MLASNPVSSAVIAFGGWMQKRKLYRACRESIEACNSEEVARIAHDIGLPPNDLRRIASLGPDAAKLLLDRMRALRLNAKAIEDSEPGTMRDLQRLCSSCTKKKRCRRDLMQDSGDRGWCEYCPSTGTLAMLQSEAVGAS
jgi:hypothetical protein